jgi:hypothetical protein
MQKERGKERDNFLPPLHFVLKKLGITAAATAALLAFY